MMNDQTYSKEYISANLNDKLPNIYLSPIRYPNQPNPNQNLSQNPSVFKIVNDDLFNYILSPVPKRIS